MLQNKILLTICSIGYFKAVDYWKWYTVELGYKNTLYKNNRLIRIGPRGPKYYYT